MGRPKGRTKQTPWWANYRATGKDGKTYWLTNCPEPGKSYRVIGAPGKRMITVKDLQPDTIHFMAKALS